MLTIMSEIASTVSTRRVIIPFTRAFILFSDFNSCFACAAGATFDLTDGWIHCRSHKIKLKTSLTHCVIQ